MKDKRHSKTAMGAAFLKAAHNNWHSPVIYQDEIAICFLPKVYQMIITNSLLAWAFKVMFLNKYLIYFGVALGRSRYCEEELKKSIQEGIDSYIILGAGFDSASQRFRNLNKNVDVFELDHPATQEMKLTLIDSLNLESRFSGTTYIPINFERDLVSQKLLGFPQARLSFVSWLGVTFYLTEEAIFSTLSDLGKLQNKGSIVVFDFCDKKLFSGNAHKDTTAFLNFANKNGEPFKSGFSIEEIEHLCSKSGYELIEVLTPDNQNKRIFYESDIKATPHFNFAKIRKT